jgi:hypothetical protein
MVVGPLSGILVHVASNTPLGTPPDLDECVGLLQRPGCGSEPVLTGDRGGAMQVATFAILLVALVAIGVRIARAVRAADRAKSRIAAPDASNDR